MLRTKLYSKLPKSIATSALIFALLLSVGASVLSYSGAGAAAPSNKADCESIGGTWKGAVANPRQGDSSGCDVVGLMKKGSAISEKLSNEVTYRQHYYFLLSCFSQRDMDKVTLGEVQNGEWLKSGGVLNNDTDDGVRGAMYANPKVSCKNGQYITEALGYFGLGGDDDAMLDAFCSLSFTYNRDTGGKGYKDNDKQKTKQACLDGAARGDFDGSGSKAAQRSAIATLLSTGNKKRADEAKKSIRGEHAYVRAYRTFTNVCSPTISREWKPTDKQSKEVRKVTVVIRGAGEEAITKPMYTTLKIGGGDSIKYFVAKSNGGWQSTSCEDLAKVMNNTAGAYAKWLVAHQDEPTDVSGAQSDEAPADATSCAVDGVGWIICPAVNFLGSITDSLYGVLHQLLKVEAGKIFDTNGITYTAWSSMRNIANVAFVIAFLFIIYSQMTGIGVSNYGIKKLLPKIIVSAVLVNISFWLCAVAVDVSNILGTSLKGFMDPVGKAISFDISESGFSATGNGWSELGVAVLASATIVYLGLSILLPALIVVLFAIVTVVAVLAMRQALIILLIVIAPLAFVAYMLPNTEEWFKKWLNLFKILLLMFPIIALIFSASALASTVVMASSSNVVVQIMGALITAVPLFITPIVMKTAGGVLNRFGGIVNNVDKGPFDRMKKSAAGVRERELARKNNSSFDRKYSLRGGLLRRNARRDAVDSAQQSELKRSTTGYIADLSEKDAQFRGKMASGGGSGADMRALANAVNIQAQLEADEVKAANAVIENLNLSNIEKTSLATGGTIMKNGTGIGGAGTDSQAFRMAAQQAVVGSGDAELINNVVDHMSSLNATNPDQAKELANFANTLERSSSKPSYIQPGDLENIRQNGTTDAQGARISAGDSNTMLTKALKDNVYSVAKMAQTGRQEMNIVFNHTANNVPSTDPGRQKLVKNAQDLLTDPLQSKNLGKQREAVEKISRL